MKFVSPNRQSLTRLGAVFAALMLISYIWFYQFQPFSDFINQLALNVITVLCGLGCALILTLITTFYERGEPPQRIWLSFALAIWMWVIGDLIWAIYNMTIGEPPLVSAADGIWTLGYIFFTVAITTQFRLVRFDKSNKPIWFAIGVWLLAILITLATLILVKSQSFSEEFLSYFYPVGDFAIGLSAVLLVIVFHRGLLARPWLGLLVFALSDGLYTWATLSGFYTYVASTGNLISLIIDLTYILAYLAIAWGAFQQYLTLRFGVTSERDTAPIPKPKLS
jgi:hypothetical protein